MHPDDRPGIRPDMTVGELVRLVDTHPSVPDADEHGHLAVQTVERDPDLDAEIMEGVRARRAPFLAMAGVGAAGWAAHGVGLLASQDAHSTVVVGTAAAAALSLPVLRLRFRRGIPEHWRRRWWLAGALGCGWVGAAAAWGADSWTMTGALVVGGAALSARWWAEWEVPHPGEVYEPEPEWEPEPPRQLDPSLADRIERAWLAAAESNRSVVPRGALLTGRTETPGGGLQYRVELDPDAGVGATAFSARSADLALIFRMAAHEVLISVDESEDTAVLTIAPAGRATLAAGLPYPGPEYHQGRVPVAGDVTGRRHDWVAYERGQGVASGLTVGDMRSGKTATLELLGLGLRSSGVWRVWVGDGDPAGASSNLLPEVAHWAEHTPEGLLRQLSAFEELLESRARQKNLFTEDPLTGLPVPRRAGQPAINEFPPCEAFPGYMWIVPELYQAVTNEQLRAADFAGRLDRLLRRAPKFGLGVAADTQSALGADFGGSTTLRSWLSRVNCFVMRTTNRADQYAVNGLQLSPGTLPSGGGWGFAAGQGGGGVMLRTMWQRDLHQWVPTLPPCEDDPDAALAIKPFLPERDDNPDAALADYQAALEEWRAERRNGKPTPAAAPAPAAASSSKPVSVGGVSVPAPLGGKVIPMPARPTQAPARPAAPLPGRADEVLAWLRKNPGPRRTAEISEGTSLTLSVVSRALGVLEQRGSIRRRHGVAEAIVSDGDGPAG